MMTTIRTAANSHVSEKAAAAQCAQTEDHPPLPRPARLQGFVENVAAGNPDATALESHGLRLTYRELDGAGNAVAHLLRARGVEPGTAVAILIERSPAMYYAILGALKAGATYVPLDPKTPHDRVAYVIADAGVQLLLTTRLLAGGDLDHLGRRGNPGCRTRRRAPGGPRAGGFPGGE